jgi:hypothetical protein
MSCAFAAQGKGRRGGGHWWGGVEQEGERCAGVGVLEGGRDLTINMRWVERGGRGGINDYDDDCRRGVQRRQRLGGKGDKGTTKGTIAGG